MCDFTVCKRRDTGGCTIGITSLYELGKFRLDSFFFFFLKVLALALGVQLLYMIPPIGAKLWMVKVYKLVACSKEQ